MQYYLREDAAPAGFARLSEDYAFQVSKTRQDWENHLYINGDTILIPNEKLTEISFTKVWSDSGNEDGIRPSSDPQSSDYFGKWLHLYSTVNGTETEVSGYAPTISVDPSDSSKWTVTYSGLPLIDGNYSVKEVIPAGSRYKADYGAQGLTSVSAGGTLTNTETEEEKVSIPAAKKWAGGAKGDEAVIVLTVNGRKTDTTLTLSESNKWSSSFDDLPRFDENGEEIEYGVTEETVEWKFTVEPDGNGGFIVTNSPKDEPGKPENPGTGDGTPAALILAVQAFCLALLMKLRGMRRRGNE